MPRDQAVWGYCRTEQQGFQWLQATKRVILTPSAGTLNTHQTSLNTLCPSSKWWHSVNEKRGEKPHGGRKTALTKSLTLKLLNIYSNGGFPKWTNKEESNLGFSHPYQSPFLPTSAEMEIWEQEEVCYRKYWIILSYPPDKSCILKPFTSNVYITMHLVEFTTLQWTCDYLQDGPDHISP